MIDGWDFWIYQEKKTADEDDDVFKNRMNLIHLY